MWIKICGIRDLKTADAIAVLDVDAIGLNFYSRSPRSVDLDTACEISRRLPKNVSRVGLFVNHSIDEIEAIASRCEFDFLQLHGDETPSFLVELSQRVPNARLIRACRVGENGLSELRAYLEECRQKACEISACLVDAHAPGVYGGSGMTAPWGLLARDYDFGNWPPLILAGGLKPANVAAAISAVQPWGIDVASGVESAPGIKDLRLMEEFVKAARSP